MPSVLKVTISPRAGSRRQYVKRSIVTIEFDGIVGAIELVGNLAGLTTPKPSSRTRINRLAPMIMSQKKQREFRNLCIRRTYRKRAGMRKDQSRGAWKFKFQTCGRL